jgi:hypothetical protein
MAAESGDFNLVVLSVDSDRVSDAAGSLASAFSLEAPLAEQICRSAPVVLAEALTKAELKEISPVLADVSTSGVEFRVTCRPVHNLPKCSLPPGAKFSRVSEPQEAGFHWNHSAFVCPCCGETFLFQRPAKITIGP